MTIDEAIKYNTTLAACFKRNWSASEYNAVQLGIEALKRVKLQHSPAGCITERLLPGETEEAHSSTG